MLYEIITGSQQEVEDTVQKQLNEGWRLHGQTFVTGATLEKNLEPVSVTEESKEESTTELAEPEPGSDERREMVTGDPEPQPETPEPPTPQAQRTESSIEPEFAQVMIANSEEEDE